MGFDQILLNESNVTFAIENHKAIAHEETDKTITVIGENFRYVFDKFKGVLSECVCNQVNYFEKPMEYNIWRAITDNDRKIAGEWISAGYDRKTVRVYESDVRQMEAGVVVEFEVGIGAVYLQNILMVKTRFEIYADGTIQLSMDAKKDPVFPYLPRFGVRMFLPKTYEEVTYIGYGPYESYKDKKRASYYDKFSTTVSQMHEDYIKPQENGSHCGCKYMSIQNERAKLEVGGDEFSYNASHYTQEILRETRHNFELEESDYTVLCLDASMSGIGSGSCGPQLIEKYRVAEDEITFDMRIKMSRV